MKRVLLLWVMIIMSGCAIHKPQSPTIAPLSSAQPAVRQSVSKSFQLLQQQFLKWQGTPYRLGGQNKRGIDCSALVQQVYQGAFDITLPRTTVEQVKVGRSIARSRLQTGDLIFFKTGFNKRHVGVFMGDGQFLHASASKGVTITELKNPYWKARYWQSRRVR